MNILLGANLSIVVFHAEGNIQLISINQNQHNMCTRTVKFKKNDTAAKKKATNEACIWQLHEICCLLGRNDSFDRDINLLRGILLTGGMNKYWAVKWSCPPIPGGSHKGSEEAETVRLWWGQQGNIKGGEHFLQELGYRVYNSW